MRKKAQSMEDMNLTTPKTGREEVSEDIEEEAEIGLTGCGEEFLVLPCGSHHGKVLGCVNCYTKVYSQYFSHI
jgi:hypothetical protein